MRFAALRLALVTLGIAGCTESTVSRDQVVLGLTAVDGLRLPATVNAAAGSQATIIDGLLAGLPSGSTCDYTIRFTTGTVMTHADGTISDCRVRAGDKLTIKLELGDPRGPIGEHTYLFEY